MFKSLFSRKYRTFVKKIKDVEVSIWEYEFKVSKSRQVREGVRQDRDRAVESTKRIETMLKSEDKSIDKKSLELDLAKHQDNAKRFESQMKMVDEQINGIAANGDNPGKEGIIDIIASLTELRNMYKDYLGKI